MRFLGVLLACIYLARASVQASERCKCAPAQYEAIMGVTLGISVPPSIANIDMKLSVDYDKNIRAITEYVYSAQYQAKILVWQDYKKGVQYVLMPDQKCTKSLLDPQANIQCIPDDAVYHGTLYHGTAKSPFQVDAYSFQIKMKQPVVETMNITMTVASDTCVMVTQNIVNHLESPVDQYQLMFVGAYNTTTGIKDPSVFNIPKQCQQAKEHEGVPHEFHKHIGSRTRRYRFL